MTAMYIRSVYYDYEVYWCIVCLNREQHRSVIVCMPNNHVSRDVYSKQRLSPWKKVDVDTITMQSVKSGDTLDAA